MAEAGMQERLQQAQAGDAGQFDRLVSPLRPELRAYCYRLTGSLSEADDAVQESLLRAWKGLASFEGRSSLRTWLYRIATHACLDAADGRRRRELPDERGRGGLPAAVSEPGTDEVLWLEPCPSDVWQATPAGPEATVTARESVGVAFLVALQHLPAQQRAVLVLREVLGWSAAEVAELLDTSVAGVNSALQRARATLESRRAASGAEYVLQPDDDGSRTLLRRYLGAWESGNASQLALILRDDAVLTMPPLPAWYAGREAIATFLTGIFQQMGPFQVAEVEVNGGLGLAVWMRGPDGAFHPQSVHALRTDGRGAVVRLDVFMDARTLIPFSLPTRP